ncbi:GNAT family N-acetyltransferase [Sphingobacterium sp. Mn56C]
MNELDIHIAQQQDLSRIVEIYNSTIASRLVTADTEPVTPASRQKWFDEHTAHKRPLWVVKDDTQTIVAWISFQSFYGRPAYDGTAEVSIYIAPEQRGKGLGQQLLQFAIEKAPEFAIKTLLGFIFSHNIPSIKLFEKFGFQEWGHFPNIAELDKVERSLSIFGKRVG